MEAFGAFFIGGCMKKLLVFIFLGVAVACAFGQSKKGSGKGSAPSWLTNPEKDFPKKEYIRAIGEGATEKAAKASAVAEISMFFETKTEVVTQAVNRSSEIVQEDKKMFSSNKSFAQIVNIKSNADFFGVNFTDPVYDSKNDKYTLLAYLKKSEAVEIYKTRIAALVESVDTLVAYAKKESEAFLAAGALLKAKSFATLAEQYIKAETVIVPSDSEGYKDTLKNLAKLDADIASVKKHLTFSIVMNPKDKKFDPVFSTICSIVEKRGMAYSLNGSKYKIVVDISCQEEEYDAGPFVRASADILVVNGAGKGLYTYSKAYPRAGSKTLDLAYTRAIYKINQDLEENFLSDY